MIIADEIAKQEKINRIEELEKVADEIIYSVEDCTTSKLMEMEKHVKPIYSLEVVMVDHLPTGNRDINNLLWTVQAVSMSDIQHFLGMFARMLKGLLGLQPFVKYVTLRYIDTNEMIAAFTTKELLTMTEEDN